MRKVIEKIHEKPIESRRQIALGSAVVLTLLIAGGWYASRTLFVPVNVFSGTVVYETESGSDYTASAAGPFSAIAERVRGLRVSVWDIWHGDEAVREDSGNLEVINEETDFDIFQRAVEEEQRSDVEISEF